MGIRLIKKNERAGGFGSIADEGEQKPESKQEKRIYPKFVQINTQKDFDRYIKPALGKSADAYGISDIAGMWWEIADGEKAPASAKTIREIRDSISKRPRFIFISGAGAERGITDMSLIEYVSEMGMTTKEYLNGYDEGLARLLYLKEHPKRRLHESLSDWADREVKIACKKENDYGTGCYKSALKAFHSLMEDGHSGFSIGITKAILDRLIEGKPLTPIEDDPDLWTECGGFDGNATYQNVRMSALFKKVLPDGTVKFDDVDRVVLVEVEDDGTETTWHSGLASKLVDEIVGPITLPYYPKEKPYKVYAQQFDSVNAEVGCFDTSHIIKIVDPDGNEIPCERFYAETDDGMEEIDKNEYLRRERSYREQLKKRGKIETAKE